jgi:hypothetical protein
MTRIYDTRKLLIVQVVCVFDRDGHQTYEEALRIVSTSDEGRSKRLLAITSWPCFEIWLLLHFGFSAAPFNAAGKKSAGDRAVTEVVKHLAGYKKGAKGLFEALRPMLSAGLTTGSAYVRRVPRQLNATMIGSAEVSNVDQVGLVCNEYYGRCSRFRGPPIAATPATLPVNEAPTTALAPATTIRGYG